jgi:CYTH domain-containing protein
MGKEIEVKYKPIFNTVDEILNLPGVELISTTLIKQGYIFTQKNKHLRVRIYKDYHTNAESAELCLKYTKGVSREEFEYQIPVTDATFMYHKTTSFLNKKRFDIEFMGYPMSVDYYPNGMVVVEVEFKHIGQLKSFVKPRWFGEDISNNPMYSNITLAKQKITF